MAHRLLPTIRGRLYTVVSALSLLLCLATMALWMRSYWWQDNVDRLRISASVVSMDYLVSYHGRIVLGSQEQPRVASRQWRYMTYSLPDLAPPNQDPYFSCHFDPSRWVITFPHALAAVLLAVLPTCWFFSPHRRRANRYKLGLCPTCGYDLRATPDRCPECGHVPTTAAIR